jgi:hypothetical protein
LTLPHQIHSANIIIDKAQADAGAEAEAGADVDGFALTHTREAR